MSRGNKIIVTADPKGRFVEGTIGDTSKPGACMQLQISPPQTANQVGRFTYVAAAPGTDGKQIEHLILLEDSPQGKTISDAYVSGTRCRMYIPLAGEEINILLGEVAGTGNSYAIGDQVILDADGGIYVPYTGSPQETAFQVMEVVTQVSGSNLTWCERL